MIVVVHETIGVTQPAETINNMGEQGQDLCPIPVVRHNILSSIPPTGHMIDGTGELNAEGTRHDAGV
jgi:hypothetical protein